MERRKPQKNTPRHERIMSAKSEIHSVIDRIFDIQWEDLDTAARARFIETGGNVFDPSFEKSEQEKQNLEEQKAQLHDAVEIYRLEHFESIRDDLLKRFLREKKRAEQNRNENRLNELRELFEAAKRAFNEILAIVAELGKDTSEESQEIKAAFAHKLDEVKENVERDLGSEGEQSGEETEQNVRGQKPDTTEEKTDSHRGEEQGREEGGDGKEKVKGGAGVAEEKTSPTWELNVRNEAIRKIKENRSAAALLVLLEYEYLPNSTENVDVEKLVERVLKEYHSVDEVERDLMRVLNDRLGHEERMKHRWDGYQVLLDALQPLFEDADVEQDEGEGEPGLSSDEQEGGEHESGDSSQDEKPRDGEQQGEEKDDTGTDSGTPEGKEGGESGEKSEEEDGEKEGEGTEKHSEEDGKEEGKEKDEKRETPKGNIMTALERQRNILLDRKIGHIKHILERYADKERLLSKKKKGGFFTRALRWLNARDTDAKLHKKYLRAQELIKKSTKDLTEEEKNFLLSLELNQFVNDRKLRKVPDEVRTYILKKDQIRLLEKRLMKLEGEIAREEVKDRNFLVRGFNEFRVLWKKFKVWYKNPENKRELRRRIHYSGLFSGIAALLGPAGLVTGAAVFAGSLARYPLSYAGGEAFRWVYDKTYGKDYRHKMAKLRKEKTEKLNWVRENVKDPELLKERIAEIEAEYKKDRDALFARLGSFVNKQQKRRIWADRIGRVVGALSLTGYQYLDHYMHHHEAVTPVSDDLHHDLKPAPMETTNHPTPPDQIDISPDHELFSPFDGDRVDSDLLTEDAFIKPGDGVTQILQRQLSKNPELAKIFGLHGNSPLDYKHLAERLGYISDKGQVLLKLNPDHGYVASFMEIDKGGVIEKVPVVLEVDRAGHLFEAHIFQDGKLTIINDVKDLVSHLPENAQTIEKAYEYWGNIHEHGSRVIEHTQNVSDGIHVEYGGEGVIDGGATDELHIEYGGPGVLQPENVEVKPSEVPEFSPSTTSTETLPTGDLQPYPYREPTYPNVDQRYVRTATRRLRRPGINLFLNFNLGGFFRNLMGYHPHISESTIQAYQHVRGAGSFVRGAGSYGSGGGGMFTHEQNH